MIKKILFLMCIALFACTSYTLQAQSLKLTVSTPGTLSSLVGTKKNIIKSLSVAGALNGSDLRFLREMAGIDADQKPTAGQLKKLDLSHASFVKGGDYYYKNNSEKKYYLKNSSASLPDCAFKRCHLEDFIFPIGCDTIGSTTLAYTGLRRVRLPKNVMISDFAFYNDSLLQKADFPEFTASLEQQAFTGCRLKQLQINNIGYISGYALRDMKSLERITIKGFLVHADGWETVAQCPKLKTIDFYGPVFSTGGPKFANDCAQLEYITFHAPILSTNFGKAENCPSFKGYIVKSIVCSSGNKDLIPQTDEKLLNDSPQYRNICKQMLEISQDPMKIAYIGHYFSNPLYNEACRYSIAGDKENAFKYLAASIDAGYKDYHNMKGDKDFNNIRSDKRFAPLLQRVRLVGDKLYLLQHSAPYVRSGQTTPRFTYAAASDSGLVAIKRYFNLDSIAGNGDEISRIKKLLYWFHDYIRHDGSSSWPNCRYNAITLSQVAKKEKRGFNCRFMAEMLCEIYLAEGFPARFLTCQSHNYDTDEDCHVINVVWSRTLHKWVWMDPTFCAFVTDDKGVLLHPGEVRERLIKGLPLVINEDANWNHKEKETKENYLENYMAKNLYIISSHLRNEYEAEGVGGKEKSPIVTLIPKGFSYKYGTTTNDDTYFWQAPEGE